MQKLSSTTYNVYEHVGYLGQLLENGLKEIFEQYDRSSYIGRQGSAFCVYFMDHAPLDFHDIAMHHDFSFDREYRFKLIENGIFNFPLPIKQGSISFAHTIQDIEETIEKTRIVVHSLLHKRSKVAS